MRLPVLISALALTLGLSGIAHAASDYYPPERLHCKATESGFKCDNFNRQYLIEDISSNGLPSDKDAVYNFTSGTAYYTPDQRQAAVFFSYHDSQGNKIRLRTVNYDIKPNLQTGSWQKFKDDIYQCNAGYMSCPITNLPGIIR